MITHTMQLCYPHNIKELLQATIEITDTLFMDTLICSDNEDKKIAIYNTSLARISMTAITHNYKNYED